MKRQHIVNVVCVKEVCMVQEQLKGDLVCLACVFFFFFLNIVATAVLFQIAEKGIRRG